MKNLIILMSAIFLASCSGGGSSASDGSSGGGSGGGTLGPTDWASIQDSNVYATNCGGQDVIFNTPGNVAGLINKFQKIGNQFVYTREQNNDCTARVLQDSIRITYNLKSNNAGNILLTATNYETAPNTAGQVSYFNSNSICGYTNWVLNTYKTCLVSGQIQNSTYNNTDYPAGFLVQSNNVKFWLDSSVFDLFY